MGDDTWLSVFPSTFSHNMTFPFDSFNVEDLHTVDEGVISHLFPLLDDPSKPFDFLVGHFLGVDHVGHRVGPEHPSMKAKLQQMNDVLKRVVEKMDMDTLLVVLGDHGMDRSGDHGGDGVLETSAGMWIYSKGAPLFNSTRTLPSGFLQHRTFPGMTVPQRAIQQIDILPSLALLLGVPIPYNNLGMVIPELFWRDRGGKILEKALELNARQIMDFLETYRESTLGGELDGSWSGLESVYKITQIPGVGAFSLDNEFGGVKGTIATPPLDEHKWMALVNFHRFALSACRSIWAQFNPILMSFGLSTLLMCLCASWSIYTGCTTTKIPRSAWLTHHLIRSALGAIIGATLGGLAHVTLSKSLIAGVTLPHCLLFGASLASSMTFILLSPPPLPDFKSLPYVLILHSLAFLSNSFTFWEDRIIPFLLVTSIIPYVRTAFRPTTPPSLRRRILGFALLFGVCVRLIAISTVCREEQQPYCRVTFFASSSLPSPPLPVLYLIVPIAVGLPYIIFRFLRLTNSATSLARFHLPLVLAPALINGTCFWIIEWVDSAGLLGNESTTDLRESRTLMAWFSMTWVACLGGVGWCWWPVCFEIVSVKTHTAGEKARSESNATINAFGAPYLIFWTIFFAVVYVCTQLTGQVVLALSAVALLSFLELLDSTRHAKALGSAKFASEVLELARMLPMRSHSQFAFQFADIIPLSLLGLLTFYGTGHQSVVSSIQWKSAFVLSSTVIYSVSMVTVILNSVGPVLVVSGLGAVLVGVWRKGVTPRVMSKTSVVGERREETEQEGVVMQEGFHEIDEDPSILAKSEGTLAGFAMMTYYLMLLLGASTGAAILRRHLMVWKVFAPRFMTAVLELVAVDVGVLLGAALGVERVVNKVTKIIRTSG